MALPLWGGGVQGPGGPLCKMVWGKPLAAERGQDKRRSWWISGRGRPHLLQSGPHQREWRGDRHVLHVPGHPTGQQSGMVHQCLGHLQEGPEPTLLPEKAQVLKCTFSNRLIYLSIYLFGPYCIIHWFLGWVTLIRQRKNIYINHPKGFILL